MDPPHSSIAQPIGHTLVAATALGKSLGTLLGPTNSTKCVHQDKNGPGASRDTRGAVSALFVQPSRTTAAVSDFYRKVLTTTWTETINCGGNMLGASLTLVQDRIRFVDYGHGTGRMVQRSSVAPILYNLSTQFLDSSDGISLERSRRDVVSIDLSLRHHAVQFSAGPSVAGKLKLEKCQGMRCNRGRVAG